MQIHGILMSVDLCLVNFFEPRELGLTAPLDQFFTICYKKWSTCPDPCQIFCHWKLQPILILILRNADKPLKMILNNFPALSWTGGFSLCF